MDPIEFNLLNWRSIALIMPILCTLLLLINSLARGTEKPSIIWLLLLTLAGAITATPMIIGFAGAYDRWPDLTFLPSNLTLFFGPLLYCHGLSLMQKTSPNAKLHLWFIPGYVHMLYQIATFTLFDDYQSKWDFSLQWHQPLINPIFLLTASVLIIVALYHTNSLRKSYLAWLAQERADEAQFDAVWFSHISIVAPILFMLWLGTSAFYNLLDTSYQTVFWTDLLCLFGLFFLVAEASNSLHREFPKMDSEQTKSDESELPTSQKDWDSEGLRIKQLLMSQKWYLEEDLNLVKLSQKVASNQSYVSKALNDGLGKSFSQVVNGLRVEFAKSLINEGEHSLLDIATISGFGSKSSFNRAFLEHQKVTPSQYKKELNKSQNLKISKIS